MTTSSIVSADLLGPRRGTGRTARGRGATARAGCPTETARSPRITTYASTLRISQFTVCSGNRLRDVEQQQHEQRPDRHLHRARAADELQRLVDQQRDDEDVDDIPPGHRRPVQQRGKLIHGRRQSIKAGAEASGSPATGRRLQLACRALIALIASATRTTCDHLRDVVDADDVRAERGPTRSRRRPCPRRARPGGTSPSAAFRNDLRDGPDEHRAARARRGAASPASTAERVLGALREAEAGIEDDAVARQCRRPRAARTRARQLGGDLRQPTSVYSRRAYMSRDRPRLCISTTAAPRRRHDAGQRRVVGRAR